MGVSCCFSTTTGVVQHSTSGPGEGLRPGSRRAPVVDPYSRGTPWGSTGWVRYAPKGARFPAGPRSLRRALSPKDRWEARQLRPCRKETESVAPGHSRRSHPGPHPKVRPGPTGHTRRCAAGCHKRDSEGACSLRSWCFPKEALEDTPKGVVGADARAAPRRTPSFALARSFRRRTASWPDTATFIGRGEEEPEGPKPQAPQCLLSSDPKTALASLANQRGRPVVVGVSPRTVRAAARSAHPEGCAAHLSPKRRCSTPGRRRVEPKLVVRRWRPPGAASCVFWEVQ